MTAEKARRRSEELKQLARKAAFPPMRAPDGPSYTVGELRMGA